MKLASFLRNGSPGYGIVANDGVIDLTARLGDSWPTLAAVLDAGGLDKLREVADGASADFAVDAVELVPPITEQRKIICIGLNYRLHIAESGNQPPTYPMLFTRYIDSLVGHGQAMVAPKASERFDYEGELAVIIGKTGRHVSAADALDIVAGYSCFNDGSVRDYQRHTTQFTPGKNFWRSGAFGPWIVTTDEIPDPQTLSLKTRLNGRELQNSSTGDLLFGVRHLIEYITNFMPLNPGDVIATGTPSGVGSHQEPPLWMKGGDLVEVEISKIGVLANPIIAEA